MLAFYLAACSGTFCIKSKETGIPNSTGDLGTAVAHFTNLGLTILGALSVIFVVVGGLQYVLSAGNPQKTKQARETILYAVVGIVIAAGAFAIVSFITGRLGA